MSHAGGGGRSDRETSGAGVAEATGAAWVRVAVAISATMMGGALGIGYTLWVYVNTHPGMSVPLRELEPGLISTGSYA